MTRVAVTGLGPVSSIGTGAEAFAAALLAGASGISQIRSFDSSGFPHRNGGEVRDFDPARWLRRLDPQRWGRSSQFAAAAARLAADDAGLDLDSLDRGRAHAVLGTTSGESVVAEALTAQILASGFPGMVPELIEQLPAGRLAHAVSEEL